MEYRQQATDRRKRQARSAKLETQATEKKQKKQKEGVVKKAVQKKTLDPEEEDELSIDSAAASEIDDDHDVEEDGPELLPEELLATRFARPPTPPPVGKDPTSAAPKSKVIKLDDDAPSRDRKVGPVTVSVLAKANKLLPPRDSSGTSRNLREKWLAGKRKGVGKSGAGFAVERRPFGGGFVKR